MFLPAITGKCFFRQLFFRENKMNINGFSFSSFFFLFSAFTCCVLLWFFSQFFFPFPNQVFPWFVNRIPPACGLKKLISDRIAKNRDKDFELLLGHFWHQPGKLWLLWWFSALTYQNQDYPASFRLLPGLSPGLLPGFPVLFGPDFPCFSPCGELF